MKYYYEAHDKFGQPVVSDIDAESEEHAAELLRNGKGTADEKKLYVCKIQTEPITRPTYQHGALNTGEAQTRVATPTPDVTPEETQEDAVAAEPEHVDEHGDPIMPTQEELQKILMENVPSPKAPERPQGPKKIEDVAPEATVAELDQMKARPVKAGFEEETRRIAEIKQRKESETKAWQATLASELTGISRTMELMDYWKRACSDTEKGATLPPGVPSVGGKTWDIFDSYKDLLIKDLLQDALSRATRRRPLQELLKG